MVEVDEVHVDRCVARIVPRTLRAPVRLGDKADTRIPGLEGF